MKGLSLWAHGSKVTKAVPPLGFPCKELNALSSACSLPPSDVLPQLLNY